MKTGKINKSDYPIVKTIDITAPIQVVVRGKKSEVIEVIINGEAVETFRGFAQHLISLQEKYTKDAF